MELHYLNSASYINNFKIVLSSVDRKYKQHPLKKTGIFTENLIDAYSVCQQYTNKTADYPMLQTVLSYPRDYQPHVFKHA